MQTVWTHVMNVGTLLFISLEELDSSRSRVSPELICAASWEPYRAGYVSCLPSPPKQTAKRFSEMDAIAINQGLRQVLNSLNMESTRETR